MKLLYIIAILLWSLTSNGQILKECYNINSTTKLVIKATSTHQIKITQIKGSRILNDTNVNGISDNMIKFFASQGRYKFTATFDKSNNTITLIHNARLILLDKDKKQLAETINVNFLVPSTIKKIIIES